MRVSGVTIPNKKRLEVSLTSVFGIGRKTANKILEKVGVDRDISAEKLNTEQETKIRREIEDNYKIEGTLKRKIQDDVKRLKTIQSYRGRRHSIRLPARGQRTKTNARTMKGAKKTMSSGRVKLQKK